MIVTLRDEDRNDYKYETSKIEVYIEGFKLTISQSIDGKATINKSAIADDEETRLAVFPRYSNEIDVN
jgi:hypothetical protein